MAAPFPAMGEARICFSDHPNWETHSADKIHKRYEIYKQAGCQMVRIHALWKSFEPSEGQWNGSAIDNLSGELKRAGFKVKLIPGVMMAPPTWLYDKYPDAKMFDQYGHYSRNCISHWYPELGSLLYTRLRNILNTLRDKDIIHLVEYIVVDLGPAGEGIYPANWTMVNVPGSKIRTEEAFACYSPLAQVDFRRHMMEKYGAINKANIAWGTEFGDWADVTIPMPNTITGRFWEDMLYWYRDTKRKTFRLQIENVTRCIEEFGLNAKPLVYLPGQSLQPGDIKEAAKTGGGNHRVRLMVDNEYLMKLADSYGCILQNTGFENIQEVRLMKQRMIASGIDYTTVWGENAGTFNAAKDPLYLAKIVIDENLWGLDYTHTRFLFENDAVTPNGRLPWLAEAGRLIRQYYSTGEKPDFSVYSHDPDSIKYKGPGGAH